MTAFVASNTSLKVMSTHQNFKALLVLEADFPRRNPESPYPHRQKPSFPRDIEMGLPGFSSVPCNYFLTV